MTARRVLRERIEINDSWTTMNVGRILHVASRVAGTIDFWHEVQDDITAPMTLKVFGTGHLIDDNCEYVGTSVAEPFVWHLYQDVS